MRMLILAAGAAGAAFIVSAPARAQATDAAPAEFSALLACRNETDAQARLRCYDAATEALARATAAGSVVLVDREDVRRTRRSLFGFNLPRLPFFRGDDSQDEDTPREIEGTVRSARQVEYGKWAVTLEDGAVWQTTEASTDIGTPRPGQTVRIRRAALGSYMISFGGGRSVRAMRVR